MSAGLRVLFLTRSSPSSAETTTLVTALASNDWPAATIRVPLWLTTMVSLPPVPTTVRMPLKRLAEEGQSRPSRASTRRRVVTVLLDQGVGAGGRPPEL